MPRICAGLCALGILMPVGGTAVADEPGGAILQKGFIYEEAPYPSCHASTLAETPEGLVAAWFGGTHERNPDVGIWVARHDGQSWSEGIEVANGVQPDGTRYPCWNPVLYQASDNGPLLLFIKVGPSPSTWWGELLTSSDHGQTWSKPTRLPEGILGPIKNKPVRLPDGTLLCLSSTEHDGWRVHLERTKDLGKTWTRTEPLDDGVTFRLIQPTILFHPDNTLQMLCRSSIGGRIVEFWSRDGGETWSDPEPTELPHPDSGIDAVTLKDGRHLLVYNHTEKGRTPLNVALSTDGRAWQAGPILEDQPGEYSYPAVIQTADGKVHITYTWNRTKVRHVVLDPEAIGQGG